MYHERYRYSYTSENTCTWYTACRSSLIHYACKRVAPPRLFTPRAKGIKNVDLCCQSYPVHSSWHQWGCVGSEGENPTIVAGITIPSHWVASLVIIAFYLIWEVRNLWNQSPPLKSIKNICVPWASELIGKRLNFQHLSVSWNAVQFLWTRETTPKLPIPNFFLAYPPQRPSYHMLCRLTTLIL